MSIVTSEESRKAYAERKNQVLELLLTAKDYYSKEERNDRADVFDKLYNDLLNGEFSIVVSLYIRMLLNQYVYGILKKTLKDYMKLLLRSSGK